MAKWKPISSAPRDGTDILCVCLCTHPDAEKYLGHMEVDRWHDRYQGFGKFNERMWPTTHWIPLPRIDNMQMTTSRDLGL